MHDVFAHIEAHRPRFLDELFTLLRQPSISTQDIGVAECAGMVRDFLAAAGIAG